MTDFPTRTHTFRLLPYEEFDPVTNMAIDEAILNLHLAGKCPPTLRFYGWEPASVSFGYSQKVRPETVSRVKEMGLSVVRRPTGGRAVLHEGELTYCFVASSEATNLAQDHPVGGGGGGTSVHLAPTINAAYKQICQALLIGLKRLEVEAELGRSDSPYQNQTDCFEATTQADLHYQGKKLVGSAQLRRKSAVLQHGSIIIDQGQNRMAEILGLPQKSPDLARHACLADLIDVDRVTLEEAIGYGFTQIFDCVFTVYPLTFEEWEVVDSLKSDPARYTV
jgi:lipoate-protein ligase A